MSRFSQAISEGDGISVIPVLGGNAVELARQAEESGAEAIAVSPRDAVDVRAVTSLPMVVDNVGRSDLDRIVQAGADGCTTVFDLDAEEGEVLDDLFPAVEELGLDCAVEVWEEDALSEVLDRLDPEILVIASPEPNDEEELEHVLDLLPDVPAGKLVIARPRLPVTPEQVTALERAGVDAILVGAASLDEPNFAAALAELTGRTET